MMIRSDLLTDSADVARADQEETPGAVGSGPGLTRKEGFPMTQRYVGAPRGRKGDERSAKESAAWRAKYEAHLASEAWRRTCNKVRDRAHGICEGCGERRDAVDVHHLTYENMGNEFMFELVLICRDCHDRLHGRRRALREAEAAPTVQAVAATHSKPNPFDGLSWEEAMDLARTIEGTIRARNGLPPRGDK